MRILSSVFICLLLAACATPEARWSPADVAPPPWPAPAAAAPEAPPEAKPTPPETPPAGIAAAPTTLPLTVEQAVAMAFEHNKTLEVAALDPSIAETSIEEARSAFDPLIAGSVTTGTRNTYLNTGNNLLTTLSALGSVGNSSGSGTSTLDTVARTVNTLNTLATVLTPTPAYARTRSTASGVTLSETLPTGTTISVTSEYAGSHSNVSDEAYQGSWNVQVNQALLRGAGTGINLITLRQARNNAARSLHAFRQQVLNVVRQVELGYWDLVLAKEVLAINEFAVRLAGEQVRLNEDLFNVGRGVEADVLSAQAERASRDADRTDALARIQTANLELIQLLNPQETNPWQLEFETVGVPGVEPVSVLPEDSVKLAMLYRPELAQARLDLANLDLSVAAARNGLLPRLDAVASYGRTDRGDSTRNSFGYFGDDNDTEYTIGLQVDSAILRRGEKAQYRRSVLSQDQGERIVAQTEQALETEVRQAVVEVERQWARVEPTREAVTARVRELSTTQARYGTGKATNLDVLIVQRDLIQAQLDEVSARVGYLQALTSLYASEGTLLDRKGIRLAEEE